MRKEFLLIGWCLCTVFSGCDNRQAKNEVWNPDTTKLNSLLDEKTAELSDFVKTVHVFYDAMRSKQWNETYLYRTTTFKQSVSREVYMDTMMREGQNWELLNYDILSVSVYDGDKVQLVVSFLESPLDTRSVSVVWWKKEKDGWKCEESGPSLLSFSLRMCAPEK